MPVREEMDMEIILGCLAPRLKEQLKGVPIDEATIDQFQADATALSRLYLRNLITSAEVDKARKRLIKRIGNAIRA